MFSFLSFSTWNRLERILPLKFLQLNPANQMMLQYQYIYEGVSYVLPLKILRLKKACDRTTLERGSSIRINLAILGEARTQSAYISIQYYILSLNKIITH
jgi:hypothetical protein